MAGVADLVGLPYLPGGRTRAGLDCWGLVRLGLAEVFGIDVPDYAGPAWVPGSDTEVATQATAFAAEFRQVSLTTVQASDVLMIRMRGLPIHVGLVIGPREMLHVEEGCDSVIENFDAVRWRSRIVAVYRPGNTPSLIAGPEGGSLAASVEIG